MSSYQQTLTELGAVKPSEALELIRKYREQRRDENFAKYWAATSRQAEIFPAFDAAVKVFGILGGNRSGKTEMGSFIAVAWALGKEYFRDEPAWEYVQHLPIPDKPNNIWVVGLDFPTLRDVIWREKLRFGKNHPPLVPKDGAIVTKCSDSDYQIFFANGSVITGKSADSGREKFQGASVDLVWIDEEPEVEIFDECYQRTVDCKGKILITLTPLTDIASGTRTPWVFDLHEAANHGLKKDTKFVQLSVMDNPYVPEEEKENLKIKWAGHYEEKARLFGDFVQRSGLVYNMWDPTKHMVKTFRVPDHWRKIVSIDPAATGVTAAVWGAVDPSGNVYLYREYYERDKVASEHAKNILTLNAGDYIDFWLIDPKWGAQRNAETHKQNYILYRDAGIQVRLAPVGEDFGLNVSREYFHATVNPTLRHPRCYVFSDLFNFVSEITHYTWAFFSKGDNKGLSKDKPSKRNDHLMNAMQYLLAQRPKGRGHNALSQADKLKQASLNSYTQGSSGAFNPNDIGFASGEAEQSYREIAASEAARLKNR